jgi:hypothetical protein
VCVCGCVGNQAYPCLNLSLPACLCHACPRATYRASMGVCVHGRSGRQSLPTADVAARSAWDRDQRERECTRCRRAVLGHRGTRRERANREGHQPLCARTVSMRGPHVQGIAHPHRAAPSLDKANLDAKEYREPLRKQIGDAQTVVGNLERDIQTAKQVDTHLAETVTTLGTAQLGLEQATQGVAAPRAALESSGRSEIWTHGAQRALHPCRWSVPEQAWASQKRTHCHREPTRALLLTPAAGVPGQRRRQDLPHPASAPSRAHLLPSESCRLRHGSLTLRPLHGSLN